jgi:hypothetical protein
MLGSARVVHSAALSAGPEGSPLRLSRMPYRRHGPLRPLVAGLLLLAACTPAPLAQPSWPAPSQPMSLSADAGLTPTDREFLTTHTHAHLDVFVDGTRIVVPGGIGIDVGAPGVREEKTSDGTAVEYVVDRCDSPCLSPLHTHLPDGILHTESKLPDQEPYTLGQFFTEWGLALDEKCVGEFCRDKTSIAIYLDGVKHEGDPNDIKLTSHLEIAIVIGKPPATIPDSHSFLPAE